MIKELLYKWFGLDSSCPTCEVLRTQLDIEQAEKKYLLEKLLAKDIPVEKPLSDEAKIPIKPSYIPWRVRQQMLEAEDREKARVMREKTEELEQELGITKDA